MESPIVIFFKNLFTQKRKLGPQNVYKVQPRTNIEELEVNLHVRSARNLPIRESSFDNIKEYLQDENKFGFMGTALNMGMQGQMGGGMMQGGGGMGYNNQYPNQYNQNNGWLSDLANGLFNQRPNVNMTGHTFFNSNAGNQSRMGPQISYDSKGSL
jgi:hypothetical protein